MTTTDIPLDMPGDIETENPARTTRLPWHRIALGAILILSAVLNFIGLNQEGYANSYYAAAVKSMLQSWHNFFFVSFDPGGFVTVDKPPLGFWLQTLSAKIFGFSSFSLLLPEALAGVLAVALLYYLVRRAFGTGAGLIAALTLALTPIAVVTNRNNTIDSLLVLTLLLGAWAVLRAAESGRLRWLLLCALFVGLGFNIKMLQAYLVVPAFGLVYLLGSPRRWSVRMIHLLVAVAVLLVVSFSWITIVDLTPASQRPYVGSSQSNSELELALGYNGIERLLGVNMGGGRARTGGTVAGGQPSTTSGNQSSSNGGPQGGFMGTGTPGPLRLFSAELGGQISWLLPLALVGMLAAAWQTRVRWQLKNRQQQSVVLWGVWLLTGAIFFSVAGFFHPYYLIMLSPALAALVGIGLVALWDMYRSAGWKVWLLPATLVMSALVQVFLLSSYSGWNMTLSPVIIVLCLIAAVVLALSRFDLRLGRPMVVRTAVTLGMIALFLAPTSWTVMSVAMNNSASALPTAGPARAMSMSAGLPAGIASELPDGNGSSRGFPASGGGQSGLPGTGNSSQSGLSGSNGGQSGSMRFSGRGGMGEMASANSTLIKYLQAHQGNASYLVATNNANSAAPIILATGEPVMALGGFLGSDPILTTEKLQSLVNNGTVRYFLLQSFDSSRIPAAISEAMEDNGATGGPMGGGQQQAIQSWVQQHCSVVPQSEWQANSGQNASTVAGPGGGEQLYSCSSTVTS